MRLDARICLHKRDPAQNMARYYALSVQPNLFGGHSVIREWGRIGQGGQVKITQYPTWQGALDAFLAKLREKQRRGYT